MIKKAAIIGVASLFLCTACNDGSSPTDTTSSSMEIAHDGLKEETVKPADSGSERTAPLPEAKDLSFESIELSEMSAGQAKDDWKFVQTIALGQIKQADVVLDVYKGKDYHALLKFNEKKYPVKDPVSDALLNEKEEPSIFRLNQTFPSDSGQYRLVGGIEILANGPGLIKYFVCDATNGKWFTFDEWGVPHPTDMDSDGNKEVVIAFSGLHLHWPDVCIVRWQKGGLEKSVMISDALGLSKFGEVKLFKTENAVLLKAEDGGRTGFYRYEAEKLIKIPYEPR